MSVVAIYGFRGVFAGSQEYDYKHPEMGAAHKCMLFLAQIDETPVEDVARAECGKYGVSEPEFSGFGLLKVEVLNTDHYRAFAGFYEEPLKNGSACLLSVKAVVGHQQSFATVRFRVDAPPIPQRRLLRAITCELHTHTGSPSGGGQGASRAVAKPRIGISNDEHQGNPSPCPKRSTLQGRSALTSTRHTPQISSKPTRMLRRD